MKRLNVKMQCFESLDSTNAQLKKLAARGAAEGTLVIANAQTGGRGRMGRSFYSPPGLGVYMSLLLRPDASPDGVQSLTAFCAVAVCMAIEKLTKLRPEIKWVNDILLDGKKICGILCESAVNENGTDYVILGIGLNVITRTEDFPPPLRETAGSLYSQSGQVFERGRLISAIVEELDAMLCAWEKDRTAYLEDYRRRCPMPGSYVAVGGRDAIVERVEPDFGLRVRYPDGVSEVLHSGEVSLNK